MLDPGVVGVPVRRLAISPASVPGDRGGAPLPHVEGGIRQYEVRPDTGEQVVQQGVAQLDLARDAVDGQVHLGDSPCRLVVLLPEDGDLTGPAPVGLHELGRLNKEAAGPTGGIQDPALERLEHLDQQPGYRPGRVELATSVTLGTGELPDEVLVRPAEDIAGLVGVVTEPDLRDRLHERAKLGRLDRRPGVDLREHPAELLGVVALDRIERLVQALPDVRERRRGEQGIPPCLPGNPEDILRDVLIAILEDPGALRGVLGEVVLVRRVPRGLFEYGSPSLERVGDVLQEQQPEDKVLVLGRLDATPHPVGSLE